MPTPIHPTPAPDADPELVAAVEAVFAAHEDMLLGHWGADVMETVNGPYQPGALQDLARQLADDETD